MQPLQAAAGVTNDEQTRNARAGLVCRTVTIHRYYTFCIENQRRFVIYRRIDDEWCALAVQEIDAVDAILTLEVELDGDGIRARCPERGIEFVVTDDMIRSGPAGFRALGACRLFDLDIRMTAGQRRRAERGSADRQARITARAPETPQAMQVAEWNWGTDCQLIAYTDFHERGRHDFLLHGPEGLVARSWDGQELWRLPGAIGSVEWARPLEDGSRRLYVLAGSRNVAKPGAAKSLSDELCSVDGKSGKILARVQLPRGDFEADVDRFDLAVGTGRLFGGEVLDVVLRVWTKSIWGGGRDLWAYDKNLSLRWQRSVDPPYGHHHAVRFFDLDQTGRDDVLAGGVLVSCDGEEGWVHDRAQKMLGYIYAVHYDSVLVGRFAEDPEADPRAFLSGGSAGLYVVDARTGRTVATHRTGNAQWCLPCRLRDDIPGTQVLAGTRWGNYGIITLFSGRGDRLFRAECARPLRRTSPQVHPS